MPQIFDKYTLKNAHEFDNSISKICSWIGGERRPRNPTTLMKSSQNKLIASPDIPLKKLTKIWQFLEKIRLSKKKVIKPCRINVLTLGRIDILYAQHRTCQNSKGYINKIYAKLNIKNLSIIDLFINWRSSPSTIHYLIAKWENFIKEKGKKRKEKKNSYNFAIFAIEK